MASYVLFVTGRYDLSNRIFPTLKDVTDVLREALGPNPVDFTVQCFGKDGRFARAFGGMAQEGNVEYIGCTTNNKTVNAEMSRFRKYLTSV